jgi:hypothetical protein
MSQLKEMMGYLNKLLRHQITVLGISFIALSVYLDCDIKGKLITLFIGSLLVGIPIWFIKDKQ